MYSIVYLLFGTVNMTIENREDIIILHSIRTLVLGNNHASLRVQSTRHGFASLMATIEDSTLLHISMSQRSYILEIDPSRKVIYPSRNRYMETSYRVFPPASTAVYPPCERLVYASASNVCRPCKPQTDSPYKGKPYQRQPCCKRLSER